jgi:hypothetical protein
MTQSNVTEFVAQFGDIYELQDRGVKFQTPFDLFDTINLAHLMQVQPVVVATAPYNAVVPLIDVACNGTTRFRCTVCSLTT